MIQENRFAAEIFVQQLTSGGGKSLIEIASTLTGGPFSANIGLRKFDEHSRFVYASDFQRNLSPAFKHFQTLDELSRRLRQNKNHFDIAFVDPWHELLGSLQAIAIGIHALKCNAILVVHDCFPLDESLRAVEPPDVSITPWSGSTWLAWSLITAELNDGHDWMTINADHGIGVLRIPKSRSDKRKLLKLIHALYTRVSKEQFISGIWDDNPEHLHLVTPDDPKVAAWA